MSGEGGCPTGSLVGAVLGTFFATLVLCAVIATIVFLKYRNTLLGQTSQLEDSKKNEESSFSSPAFTPESTSYEQSSTLPIREPAPDSSSGDENGRMTTPDFQYNVQGDYVTTRDSIRRAVFQRSLPDAPSTISFTNSSPYLQEPETVELFFNGQHPLGLGFTIHGNMSEGIFVETVADQGPADGALQLGDQITRLTLFMDHVVLEDILKIFSCISIYPIQLRVRRARIPVAAEANSAAATDGVRIRPGQPNFLRQSLVNVSDWFPGSSEQKIRHNSRPRRTTTELGSYEGVAPAVKTTEQNEECAILEVKQVELAPGFSSQNQNENEGLSAYEEIELNEVSTRDKVDLEAESRRDAIMEADGGFESSEVTAQPAETRDLNSPQVTNQSSTPVKPLSEVTLLCRKEELRKEQLLQERTSKTGMAYFINLQDHFGEFPA